uniref:GH14339p n=1 Tax=Drosophila melanogaster TaxID=7227 RepID=A9UN32_DROME|nr:GH14339p [Drosophila melanogaster]
MPRLSVFCGLSRRIICSSTAHRNLWRLLSDSSESTIIPHVSDKTESVKKFKKETQVDHTSHLFVWPEAKDENVHHVKENKEDSNDDITASWGWKNDELDVEQLAGLPSPNEVEDPYRQPNNESQDDQLPFAEGDQSGIQEELQFARTRSLREQLVKNHASQEPFTSFEKTSLTSVRRNVDFMMQELSQISLILNTMGGGEKTMGMVNSEPDVASFALNQPKISESLNHEEESNQSVDRASSHQSELGVADSMHSEVASALSEPSGLGDVESLDHSEISNQSFDSELTRDITDQLKLDHEMEANQSLDSELTGEITNQSSSVVSESSISDEDFGEELIKQSHKIEQIASAGDTQESSPSKTNENTPKTDDTQDTQPKETIHTYRPFRTIEVPAKKPTSSLSTESIEEQPLNQEPQFGTGIHLDRERYKVSAQLTESESRLLMRMALKQALIDLESGQSKYKATILEAETE